MRRWDPRRPGGCRAPGKRAPGGPVHRGAAHAGTGTDRRRAGPDGAHHQARQGEPGPRSARARRDSRRRPVRTGAGWSTSPAVPTRHGVPRCTAFVTGPVRDGRIVGRGHQHAHGAPGRGRRPGTGDPGRESTATAVIPGAWSTTATTDPSHLSIAYTGRLVDEGTGRLGRSRGLLPAQAPPPRPRASPLQARGPFWRNGPWKDRDDPLKPQPPAG